MARKTSSKTAAQTENTVETNDADLEAAVASIETPETSEAQPSATVRQSLAEMLESVTDVDAEAMSHMLAKALDDRADFEERKSADNRNIQRTIKKLRSAVARKTVGRLFASLGAGSDFVNRQIREGSGYNVYAIDKLADLVNGLTGGETKNAVNKAVLQSLFQVQAAGLNFNMETAKMCVSRNYTPKDEAASKARRHLIRHTMAPGTASTQASSTMQALGTLGVVAKDGKGFNLLDNAVTDAFAAKFAPANQ